MQNIAANGNLSAAYSYNTATDHTGYNSSGLYHGAVLQLPQGRNWILSQTFDSNGNAASEVSYYNALGYPEQDVSVRASGDLSKDLVTPHVSDYLFRELKAYLPYPLAVSGSHGAGAFAGSAATTQNLYYCSRFSVSGDACGYATAMTEEASDGRPLWNRRPGKDYYNAGKTTVFSCGANSTAVRQYAYDAYPSGMPSSLAFSDVSGITTSGGVSLHQGGTSDF